MRILRQAWRIVWKQRRAYLALNLAYYGLIGAAMLLAVLDRRLQRNLLELNKQALMTGVLAPVMRTYAGGSVMLAAAWTLVVNLVGGSFASITLPSLVVPFSGLLVAG